MTTFLTVLLSFIVLLLLVGVAYEIGSAFRDRRRYRQAPGERVNIGALNLHIVHKGQREPEQPAIVLESGIGGNWLDWELVVPRIANIAQVVAYDRAGYGWSDEPSTARPPESIIEELHSLLHASEVEPPYILVGHSFGGMYTRLFAATYPDEVAGLILVDASNPTMLDQQDTAAELRRLRNVTIAKRIGLLRLMMRRMLYRADHLFGDSKPRYIAFNMLDSGNVVREARPIFENGIELPDTVDVPLIVISRQTDEDISAEEKWADYQTELLGLSSDAKHMVSEKSSHYIALSDPELVEAAVRDMLGVPEEDTTEAVQSA